MAKAWDCTGGNRRGAVFTRPVRPKAKAVWRCGLLLGRASRDERVGDACRKIRTLDRWNYGPGECPEMGDGPQICGVDGVLAVRRRWVSRANVPSAPMGCGPDGRRVGRPMATTPESWGGRAPRAVVKRGWGEIVRGRAEGSEWLAAAWAGRGTAGAGWLTGARGGVT